MIYSQLDIENLSNSESDTFYYFIKNQLIMKLTTAVSKSWDRVMFTTVQQPLFF